MDSTTNECGPYNTQQLYYDHLVGKVVRVAHRHAGALLPPSLETQVENGDADREDGEDADDGEGCNAESASRGVEAVVHLTKKACTGRLGTRRKGGIGGGRGVDWHNCRQ